MFLGVAKDDGGNDRIFLENNSDAIAFNLASGVDIDYFLIDIVVNVVTLKRCTLKAGPRADGRDLEIAEILAGGNVVGSAEVEKP